MDPADLQALQNAIEASIANGFTNAVNTLRSSSASIGTPPPGSTGGGGGTGGGAGGGGSMPTPPPGSSGGLPGSSGTGVASSNRQVGASQSLIGSAGQFISTSVDLLNIMIEEVINTQNRAGTVFMRSLATNFGVRTTAEELVTGRFDRILNEGERAAAQLTSTFIKNSNDLFVYEGLELENQLSNHETYIRELGDANIKLFQSFGADKEMEKQMQIFQTSIGITAREVSDLMSTTFAETGEASTDILENIANHARVIGDAVGVPFKMMAKGIVDVRKDMEFFTDITDESAARLVASLNQVGMTISSFQSLAGSFRSFDASADKIGEMSAVFGIQLDALEMMYLANEDEEAFLHKIRDQILDQGLDVESMSKTRQRALANQMGLSVKEMKQFMNTGMQMTSLEELQAKSREASTRDQVDAMEALNSTMVKVTRSMSEVAAQQTFFRDALTGGAAINMSEAVAGAQKELVSLVTSSSDVITQISKLEEDLQNLGSGVINKIKDLGVDALQNFPGSGIGSLYSEELSKELAIFGQSSGPALDASFNRISQLMLKSLQDAGLVPRSWPEALKELGVIFGTSDFPEGSEQMSHYIKDIENWGASLTEKINETISKISESINFSGLTERFQIESQELINSEITSLTETMSTFQESIDEIGSRQIEVSPSVSINPNTTVVREESEEIAKAIQEISDNLKNQSTEIHVSIDMDQLKETMRESIAQGFENSDYKFNLAIDGFKFAEILKRTRDTYGVGIQLRGGTK